MRFRGIAVAIILIFLLFLFLYSFYVNYSKITGLVTIQTNVSTTINAVYNNLTVEKLIYIILAAPGNTSSDTFNVTAAFPGNTGLNVTLNKSGDIKDWISLETDILNLTAGEKQAVGFNVTPPSSQALGIYYGWINATSTDGQRRDINITVNVTTSLGRINVSVKDTIGNPVDGATVFIWDMVPLLKDSGTTNSNGLWLSKWLDPGNYTIEVVKSGYQTARQNTTVYATQITQVNITLQPSAAPILDVSPSSISESATVGNSVTRVLTILNIGDMDLINATLNSSQSWITFSNQFIPKIEPGNYTYVNAYLGPISISGIYYGSIIVNSSNDGTKTIPVVFQVSPLTAGPSGGAVPSAGQVVLPKSNLTIIDYPNEIAAMQGEIRFVTLLVKNTGETNLPNTSIQILGIDSDWYSIDPASTSLIKNASQTFIIKFKIPNNAVPADMPIVFKASSGSVIDVKPALLAIKPIVPDFLRITDISVSKFVSNQKGHIYITVENSLAMPMNVTIKLDFPKNFLVDEKVRTEVIDAHQKKQFVFTALSDETGTFMINMTAYYDGKKTGATIPINVYGYDTTWITLVLAIPAIILITLIIRKLIKRRRREEIVSFRLAGLRKL